MSDEIYNENLSATIENNYDRLKDAYQEIAKLKYELDVAHLENEMLNHRLNRANGRIADIEAEVKILNQKLDTN